MRFIEGAKRAFAACVAVASVAGVCQLTAEAQSQSSPPVPGVSIVPPSGQVLNGAIEQPKGKFSILTSAEYAILQSSSSGPELAWAAVKDGEAVFDSQQLPATPNNTVGTIYARAENCAQVAFARACKKGQLSGFTYVNDVTGPNITKIDAQDDQTAKGIRTVKLSVDEPADVHINDQPKGMLMPGIEYKDSVRATVFGPITATIKLKDRHGNERVLEENIGTYDPIGLASEKFFSTNQGMGRSNIRFDYSYPSAVKDANFSSSVDLYSRSRLFPFSLFGSSQTCSMTSQPRWPTDTINTTCAWSGWPEDHEFTVNAKDDDTGLERADTFKHAQGDWMLIAAAQAALCGSMLLPPATLLALQYLKNRKRYRMQPNRPDTDGNDGGVVDLDPLEEPPEPPSPSLATGSQTVYVYGGGVIDRPVTPPTYPHLPSSLPHSYPSSVSIRETAKPDAQPVRISRGRGRRLAAQAVHQDGGRLSGRAGQTRIDNVQISTGTKNVLRLDEGAIDVSFRPVEHEVKVVR